MKYKLIDLGRPKERVWTSAFLHTQNDNLLIKGGSGVVANYLPKMKLPYFGKIVHFVKNNEKTHKIVEAIAGNGLKILKKYVRSAKQDRWNDRTSRSYYEIRSEKYNVLIKRVRRLPTAWLREINMGIDDQVLVATDFLRDHGFELAADVLIQAYHKANTKESYSYEM